MAKMYPNLWLYYPSQSLAIVAAALFGTVTILHVFQLFRTRAWFMTPFVIGGICETIGAAARVASAHQTPEWTLPPFVITTVFSLIPPPLFSASLYMLIVYLIRLTNGHHFSLISPLLLTKVFITGDVVSVLLQAAGGGIMGGKTEATAKLGEHVITAGLAVQLLFFSIFVVTSIVFHRRMAQNPTAEAISLKRDWTSQIWIVYITSILILIRSIYRMVEYTSGQDSVVVRHEACFYCLDLLLMFIVMAIVCLVHPSKIYVLQRRRGTYVELGLRIKTLAGNGREARAERDDVPLQASGGSGSK